MRWVHGISCVAPFVVATTEAPSYRRVAMEEMPRSGGGVDMWVGLLRALGSHMEHGGCGGFAWHRLWRARPGS